jgi:hypothetical protein
VRLGAIDKGLVGSPSTPIALATLSCVISGNVTVGSVPRGSARPDLAVGLEAIYHHLPLGLILPEVTEE